MDFGEIAGYIATAVGGGGITALFNWRYNKKKNANDLKSDEIENMRKAMMDFYEPLVAKQNELIEKQDVRIAQLEREVSTLRSERRELETAYQNQIAAQQKQIADLQKQITDITRALGIRANKQMRNELGQYIKVKK